MVLSKSEQDKNEDEDTTEVGLFDDIEDENLRGDMADMPHGPITNPRITNLFSSQRGWRVLRLPGGRAGDEGPGVFWLR